MLECCWYKLLPLFEDIRWGYRLGTPECEIPKVSIAVPAAPPPPENSAERNLEEGLPKCALKPRFNLGPPALRGLKQKGRIVIGLPSLEKPGTPGPAAPK